MVFKALRVKEVEGTFQKSIEEVSLNSLPQGEVLIKVSYSSLNYKDALSCSGNKGVTKSYPHTPGIDAVGVVHESLTEDFKKGDAVLVTGFDLGMNTWGGFSEYIRVPKEWVLKIPQGLSPKEAAIYGTGGFTAGQCVSKLVSCLNPNNSQVIVSGATGGVGTMSIAILSKLGYKVVAITGKSEDNFLKSIGASEIIDRKTFLEESSAPMLKSIYSGAVDTAGGKILENIIKQIKIYGVVTCCGNIGGVHINTTVFPFILRGISLIGITSQSALMEERKRIWGKLSSEWKPNKLMDMYEEVSLESLPQKVDFMLKGQAKGRVIVKM